MPRTSSAQGLGTPCLSAPAWNNHSTFPIQEYPDCEASALIAAVATANRRNLALVLEDFGEFIAPTLMKLHGHLLLPEWKTIDVIDHTEGTIHSVVRMKDSAADPPHLTTKRLGPDEVLLIYTSPRKMRALAVGLSKGLAKHFAETIVANHRMCTHCGAQRCEIIFRKMREPLAAKMSTIKTQFICP
jgi:hypothetical protein